MYDQLLSVYYSGLGYSVFGGAIISVLFAIYRWHKCVQQYIETGRLDEDDDSWFFGANNWFYGSRDSYDYGMHPVVVAADMLIIALTTTFLSLGWPITVIVFGTIAYAKIARVRYERKKEFIERLEGKHA